MSCSFTVPYNSWKSILLSHHIKLQNVTLTLDSSNKSRCTQKPSSHNNLNRDPHGKSQLGSMKSKKIKITMGPLYIEKIQSYKATKHKIILVTFTHS